MIRIPRLGEPLEGADEDVLRDVLGCLGIADDAEGDAHDRGILLAEEPLEPGERGPWR